MWGREDAWVPLEKGQHLQAMIPGSLLRVIADGGHLVIEEPSERLMRAIRPFLVGEAVP